MNLLAAAVLLLQDPSPEEVFRRIEKSLATAATVRVRYKTQCAVSHKGKVIRNEMSGLLLLKEGKRLFHRFKAQQDGKEVETTTVSDGKWISLGSPKTPIRTVPLHCSNPRTAIAFGGHWGVIGLTNGMKETDYSKILKASNFRLSEAEGEVRTLSYDLTADDVKATSKVTVWFNMKSLALSRQRLDRQIGSNMLFFDERYEEFSLQSEIPDSTFALPSDKAAEETLIKIEERASTAKGLDVAFRCDLLVKSAKRDDTKVALSGTLQSRGTKTNYTYAMTMAGTETKSMTVCDGKSTRLLVRSDGKPDKVTDNPDPDLVERLALFLARKLVRQGLGTTLFYPKEFSQEGAYEIIAVTGGEDDGGAKTLSYIIDFHPETVSVIEVKF